MKRYGHELLRCSFCRKTQDVVRRLISSPGDHPRAFICNECVAVCDRILEEESKEPEKERDNNNGSDDEPPSQRRSARESLRKKFGWIWDAFFNKRASLRTMSVDLSAAVNRREATL